MLEFYVYYVWGCQNLLCTDFWVDCFVCQENFEFKRVKTRVFENKSPVVGKNGKNE